MKRRIIVYQKKIQFLEFFPEKIQDFRIIEIPGQNPTIAVSPK